MAATCTSNNASSSRTVAIDPSPLPHTILDLRQLLARRFPRSFTPSVARLATGLPAIDAAIGGGLPKSAITELTSSKISAGTALFVQILLQNAQRHGYFLAL